MWRSLGIIIAVWLVGYVAALGSSELRSEEGHRVLPAVEMLDGGDYIVPHIGGQPYLRKPPLINWLVAGSFRAFGTRNEWTARLPSALSVLSAAVVFAIIGRRILGEKGALMAALVWLTNLGMLEKGRMIEIDALYVSLCAIALVCWLTWWEERRSPWLIWTIPWIFLGLDLLAKGPAHLIFFYAAVVAILWRTQKLRDLLHQAHFIGLLVMLGIFATWAVPYFSAVHTPRISQTWTRELAMRLTGGENDATNWPMNFPRGCGYFMPWLLLLPFIRTAQMSDTRQRQIAAGLAWGAGGPFVVTLLLPGTIPRYILPSLAPVCWLIGMAVRDRAFHWRLSERVISIKVEARAIWWLIAAFAIASLIIFPVRSATFLRNRPKVKSIAAKVNAAVSPGETVYALNPLFQPYLFYVHAPVRYLGAINELPPEAHYVITSPGEKARLETSPRWLSAGPRLLLSTPEYRGHETLLFHVNTQ